MNMHKTLPNSHCPLCCNRLEVGQRILRPIDGRGPAIHESCYCIQADVNELLQEVGEREEELANQRFEHHEG
jgi:hypothetical protein